MIINQRFLKSIINICASSALVLSFNVTAQQDPLVTYVSEGKPVAPWQATIGNALNWSVPVKDQSAETERKNLTVSASKKNKEGDALLLKWKGKKVKGQWGGNILYDSSFTLTKNKIDLSSVKDKAAITFDIKINRSPNEATHLAMQCNYNNNTCQSKFPLKQVLKQLPKDEWFSLPIPLACFSQTTQGTDFDYKNITSILSIATQGKLEIEIANIGLTAMPEGKTGCQ